MNNKDFTLYQEALGLKEIGFDETCIAKYTVIPEDNINWFTISEQAITDNSYIFGSSKNYNTEWFEIEGTISAPTFSQAFRWFDEHTDLMGFVVPSIKDNHFDWLIRIDWEEEIECEEAYTSRSEAELACLKQLIKIAKEKQNE